MASWISWKHLSSDYLNPLTYKEKVDVFYEQTLGWQLHIADLLSNGGSAFPQPNTAQLGYPVPNVRHSGFAVLQICFSYFELVGSLTSFKSRSTERFGVGVMDVFPGLFKGTPEDAALLKRLYEGARCELYHTGRTGALVGLGQPSDGSPIAHDPRTGAVVVNPHRLPVELKAHLEKFKNRLLDPANASLRERFEERFDEGFK